MHDEDADGGGDAGQLRGAVDLGVVHVEARGDAPGRDGLAQAVQKSIQSLVGIELGVRDEAAGIVQRGLEKDLLLAAPGPFNPGAEQHIGLPDLIGELRFVLLVGGGFVEQQLALGEPADAQKTIERGSRQTGLVRLVGQRQLAQQSGAGTMRVLTLEPFDEGGGFRRHGAGLSAVLTRFGRQCGQSVAAIAQRPVQQRVHRDLAAGGVGNVIEAGGEFVRTAREFAARQRFQNQGGDEPVTKQRDFFGFVVHGVFLPSQSVRRKASRFHANGVCGGSGGRGGGGECGAAAVGSQTAGPAQQVTAQAGEQEAVSGDPAGGFEHGQGAVHEAGGGSGFGQRGQHGAQCFGLRAEATNPELAALIGHRRWRGLGGAVQGLRQEQPRDEKQRNHRQTGA